MKMNDTLLLFRLTVILILCSSVIDGQHVLAQSPRTFYIGHSLSDQIPDMVQSLSDDHDDVNFSWVYQSIPGAPLHWQWARKDSNDYIPNPPYYAGFYDTTFGLPSATFDALVLTEAVPRYPAIMGETYRYADSFYQYAVQYNATIKVYLYEVWHCLLSGTPTECDYDVDSNPWRQRLEDDLPMWESIVDTLNALHNPAIEVCLIPVGQGLAALYDSIQLGVMPDLVEIEDLFSDNIHLNDTGKYFAACIHFAMIHGVSPVGLTNQTQVWWGGDFDPPSPALALKFQEIAWRIATEYEHSCISGLSGVDVQLDSASITLLPNPTNDIFEIEGLTGAYDIQILDASGMIVQTLSGMGDRIEIDIQSLPAGLYFVRIASTNHNDLILKKILKTM